MQIVVLVPVFLATDIGSHSLASDVHLSTPSTPPYILVDQLVPKRYYRRYSTTVELTPSQTANLRDYLHFPQGNRQRGQFLQDLPRRSLMTFQGSL